MALAAVVDRDPHVDARARTPRQPQVEAESIAVDDAGAGYASMRHVLATRPDFIKLDITLTRGLDTDRPRRALASALIEFARQIGSRVIAEGVESKAESEALDALGVDDAQGYFLSRPLPLQGLRDLLGRKH